MHTCALRSTQTYGHHNLSHGLIQHSRLLGQSRRTYARIVGGVLNQPPPGAPSPQSEYKVIQVTRKQGNASDKTERTFDLDISKAPSKSGSTARHVFEKILQGNVQKDSLEAIVKNVSLHTPLAPSPRQGNHNQSQQRLIVDHLTAQASLFGSSVASFKDIQEQAAQYAMREIPRTLENGNAGLPKETLLSTVSESVVSIVYFSPPTDRSPDGRITYSSGFAIADGTLIATCTHPVYQHTAMSKLDPEVVEASRTLIVTHDGRLIPVHSVASSLPHDDLMLLNVDYSSVESGNTKGRQVKKVERLRGLPVSQYPLPILGDVLVYNHTPLHFDPLCNADTDSTRSNNPFVRSSTGNKTEEGGEAAEWRRSMVTSYQNAQFEEVETGGYSELATLLFHLPFFAPDSPGSPSSPPRSPQNNTTSTSTTTTTTTNAAPSTTTPETRRSVMSHSGGKLTDGSSGSPIIDARTYAVVGITRGREFGYGQPLPLPLTVATHPPTTKQQTSGRTGSDDKSQGGGRDGGDGKGGKGGKGGGRTKVLSTTRRGTERGFACPSEKLWWMFKLV